MVNNKSKYFSLALKIAIGLASFSFIYFKFKNSFTPENIESIGETLTNRKSILLLILCVLLFLPNWLIESYKWKLITGSIESVSFSTAFKSVLSGLCIGNLTPGRFGEFIGRILYFKEENRTAVTFTHFACGISQLVVTIVIGLLALTLTFSAQKGSLIVYLAIGCLAFLIFILWVYFNTKYFYQKISKLKWLSKFNFRVIDFPKKTLFQLLILSLARYIVFFFQYYFLLYLFNVRSDFVSIASGIAISYMLLSSIPMISFIEIAIRGAVAMLVFGSYSSNNVSLFLASSLVWLINIVLPSIIGYVFLVRINFNFKKSLKT